MAVDSVHGSVDGADDDQPPDCCRKNCASLNDEAIRTALSRLLGSPEAAELLKQIIRERQRENALWLTVFSDLR